MTTRELQEEQALERLGGLPLVSAMVPFTGLLVPEELQGDEELRTAAARLHADMVLVYTVDTTFRTEDRAAPVRQTRRGWSLPPSRADFSSPDA